jgi:uncharacterized Tic20 family protein
MAMLAHLLGLFFSVLGPLVIWLTKREDDEFIDDQGKEALNWEITMLIGYVVSCFLMFIIIGFVLIFVVGLVDAIFNIVGAMKANSGIRYRYPFAIRLLK